MKLKTDLKAITTYLLAIIVFFTIIGFLGSNDFKSPKQYPLVQLDDGWTIYHGNLAYNPVSLTESAIGMVHLDDQIILTRVLPDYSLSPAVIHYRTILSSSEVYLNDELIYEFGKEYYEQGKMLPKFQNFVVLPDDFAGKTIKIVITAHESNAFSGLSPVTIGNQEEISREMAQRDRMSLAIGVFLVVFGIMLLIIFPYLIVRVNHDYSIAFSGIISMLMGLYILSFNDLFWLFSDEPSFYTFIEYFSLYSIPAAILGFLTVSGQISSRTVGTVLWIINIGFLLISTLSHLLNIIHVCMFVSTLHVIAISEGIYIIIALVMANIKKNRKGRKTTTSTLSKNTLILGLALFVACSLIDIVKFNVMKFSSTGEVNSSINFMTVGSLLFVMSLIMTYFFHCSESINEITIQHQLEGLAYSDALTGLSNRTKCELFLSELSGDYTIISIDLDYLKYTNDNYGHAAGDNLLSGFSDILKNSFTDASLIARMGGDEFMVILPYIDDHRVSRSLQSLEDLMSYRNTADNPIKYSASYGIANNKDPKLTEGVTSHKVYLLADARMYQMKKKHHQDSFSRLYNDLISNLVKKEGNVNE